MDNTISILAVDDEQSILDSIHDFFNGSYRIEVCSDPRQAMRLCREKRFDILLADHRMPDISGFELLLEAKKNQAYICGIMLTAYADKDLLIKVVNQNLIQYILEKPLDLDLLSRTFREAEEYILTVLQNGAELRGAGSIIGLDGDLSQTAGIIRMAAPTDENILITGETGTGKELIAKMIHRESRRADGPFVKINCAAIPDSLLESELFGYVRGAFTGAGSDRIGKIETAERGTLFLDEIGEMRPELQSKLLTVLQDRKIERLGSNRLTSVDFRLITATNQDIARLVAGRRFRDDLYYRLNTVHIHLPPLRDRKNDLTRISRILVNRFGEEFERPGVRLSENALRTIRSYSWPGNIRELENALKRALILLPPGRTSIEEENLRFLFPSNQASEPDERAIIASLTDLIENRRIRIENIEDLILAELLSRYGGNIPGIVDATSVPRDRLYRYRRKLTSLTSRGKQRLQ